MGPLPRRLTAVVVTAAVLAVAPAVVPVRMAWSAPGVQFVELAPPRGTGLLGPFAGVTRTPARPVTVPFALSHLGVRWTGDEEAVVEVRTASRPGAWGRWRPLEVAHDLGDDARAQVLSGLVGAPGARLVQVRARGDARRLRIIAIDATNGPRRLVRAPLEAAGAQVAQPGVVSRAQWGADESMRRGRPEHAPLRAMVVHHTVTPNDDPDPAATMRAMYAYHVRANGWDDIGYNFVVDGAGRVYEGRYARDYGPGETPTGETADGLGVVGAHAEGANAGSVGVAVMGTFTGRAPSDAAVDAVRRVLAWKADRHGIAPEATISWPGGRRAPTIAGHRDVGSTACPGDQLYARLPAIRRAVAAAVQAGRAALTPGYLALGRDGRVLPFGRAAAPLAGAAGPLLAPAAAVDATPSGLGYWVVSDGGRVVPFGDAVPLGSPEVLGPIQPAGRAVAIEATPSGLGYWVAEESGRVRAFGDAPDLGSSPVAPVVAMARTPSGRGYWVAAADGRVSAHGDAPDLGPPRRGQRLPIVAMAAAHGGGYWLVAEDGTVAAFGAARPMGGLAQLGVRVTVVDAQATSSGRGYYLLARDGSLFTFGDAAFHGAPTGLAPAGAVSLALLR